MKTNRVTLRTLKTTDAEAVFELLTDPEVMTFLGPRRALSRNEAEQWFEAELTSPSRYVVALTSSDELIGFCGMKVIGDISDFGYFLRKKFWAKGYASESCLLVIAKLSEDFDISTLQVFIAKQNHASLALAKKLNWLRLCDTMKNDEPGFYFQLRLGG
ncbi:GNAT family N-acetyltransferase [Psychromonas sp. Urea-02u-13]|uniref:GNAT family N-acetyltransferase n=1 Tax=Psychromonas sp. Urea-02u-13 TaxID=2058326 RepID=UPI000C3340B5|nr:GNAT family N-acetyltransferase [Psychromonas sp. Urea-02u-13]PKG40143.1 GNAT family N-acetyltransferase [Psychromonas sp. Urea-02u-13]